MELEIAAGASDLAGLENRQALVERARWDREAFAQLYRAHYRAIAGYVYRRVGDVHLAEDLVADVFVIAMRAIPRYRDRGIPIRAWLYRIATNRANRWARRERRRMLRQPDADPVDRGGKSDSADSNLGRARAALLTLAPKYQSVLALHYLEGMPVATIAQALGYRLGTVKSRLARGRQALRQRLEQRRSQR